jgi:acetylglutamate kinase
VDVDVLDGFRAAKMIPVIAPIGAGEHGESFNINADTVAGAVAAAVKAARFLLLTDVPGVLDAEKKLIPELSAAEARRLIADGTISGGMIPKVETCLEAVTGGAEAAVILDGRVPHALLLELFTEGVGTLIRGG